jgi:hypothetical protein
MATPADVETGKLRGYSTLWMGISYVITIVVVLAVVARL